MLEWIESPTQDPQIIFDLFHRLPEYSRGGRIGRTLKGLRQSFPQSEFQVFEGGADIRSGLSLDRYCLIANFAQNDITTISPQWLSGSEDYFWVWNDLVASLKAAALQTGIELNYFKESREQLHFVMRNYQLARPSDREKTIYHFDLRVVDPERLDVVAEELAKENGGSYSLKPGLLIQAELFLSPDTLIFLEKVTALFQAWLAD